MRGISIIIAHLDGVREGYFNNLTHTLDSQLSEKVYPWEILKANVGNKIEARNLAAEKARYEILVFFDDDVEPKLNCIDELLNPFYELENVGVVGGVNVAFPDASYHEQLAGRLWANVLVTGRSSARYTPKGILRDSDEAELQSCVMAIRKDVFNEVGGFPDVIPCEENILYNNVSSAGYRLIYNPFAIVYHRRPSLYWEYVSVMHFYGTGRGYMMRMGHIPKMVYGVNSDTVRLFIGWVLGTFAYGFGIIRGLITYRSKREVRERNLREIRGA